MANLPPLIPKGQASRILGLPLYAQLAPRVPHLRVAHKLLFPAAYIEALARYESPEAYTLAGRVCAFARTGLARDLQLAAVRRIERALADTEALTATQVAELLCVSRETVAIWYETNVIHVDRSARQVPRRDTCRPREFVTVPVAELRRLIVWQLPDNNR